MTKEQIIAGLQNAAKPYEEYYIEDDLIDAINQYPEPFELVEPILESIATNPLVDFGMPGDLVHFVEQFYKHGYEKIQLHIISGWCTVAIMIRKIQSVKCLLNLCAI